MKTKKVYQKPQMKVCKVHARVALMQGSNYPGPAGFRDDAEKDYYA